VLDVGCGNGVLTNLLDDMDLAVGTDRSFTALQFIQKPRTQSDIVRLPFGNSAFDAVLATEVVEHIPDSVYATALAELARVASHYLLITVPYCEALWLSCARCPRCGTRFHQHGHVRSYQADTMDTLFAGVAGVRLVRKVPIFPVQHYLLVKEGQTLYKQLLRSGGTFPRLAVCPQCGYGRAAQAPAPRSAPGAQPGGRKSALKRSIKQQWPLVQTWRWWLALYEKDNHAR
jgi:SAM-dependent methyltransferase